MIPPTIPGGVTFGRVDFGSTTVPEPALGLLAAATTALAGAWRARRRPARS